MKWEVKKLGEVCDVIGGGTPSKAQPSFYNGNIPWATVRDMKSELLTETEFKITEEALRKSSTNIIPCGNVVIATRVGLGKACLLAQDTAINQDLRGIIPKSKQKLDVGYLFYWLKSVSRQIIDAGVGATVQGVKLPFIKGLEIPLPAEEEQRRIVTILDEAFAAIDKAKEAVERNLQNVQEVFEGCSERIFNAVTDAFNKTKLGLEVELLSGYPFKSSLYTSDTEDIKLLRGDNIIQDSLRWDDAKRWLKNDKEIYKEYELAVGDVVIAMDRPWIKAGLKRAMLCENDLPCLLVQRTARLRAKSSILPQFLRYLLGSRKFSKHILGVQTGIGVPHISGQQIKDFEFFMPPIKEQLTIVKRLERISVLARNLERIYRQKLLLTEDLKAAVLQKAFAGELTRESRQTIPILLPTTVPNISTTDLQAGITALALQRHIAHKREHSFHHVKAEKNVHLCASILNLELDRTPVKDAAGPNDFPRAKHVESRARKAGFYTVRKSGNAYYYTLGSQSGKLIEKLQRCLGAQYGQLIALIDLLVPMDKEQAEILATVYAAWNNLIIDGAEITDEAIVYEARENWHPDKLSLERARFFKAIEWMKSKKLLPNGNGKKVISKAS